MTVTSTLTFFIAIFIFGITPGPGVFAILARALSQGARACLALAFGMTISDVVYLVLACFSLSAIAENYGTLFTLIRYVGAAYLMFLGWKLWTAPAPVQTGDVSLKRSGYGTSFLQGMAISASNPKVILFYIAFLPSFMDLTRMSPSDIALAAALTIVALMAGLMAIAWGAARARKLARSSRAMQRLNRTAGSIMIGAGALLAIKS
jgi:threonine/homoserine/homoserine lactone efflux protein